MIPHERDSTPNVRVLSPWDSYKDWKAGQASLTHLLALIAENAAGLASVMHLLGYQAEARRYKEQAEAAVALFRRREAGAPDDALLAEVDALIEGYRPTIRVLPLRRTQSRVHRPYPEPPLTIFRTTIDLQVDEGARGTYCVQAEQEGSRPRASASIWSVYRVKERSWYYGERLESLAEGLTRRAAVQRMKAIAQEQA